MEENQAVQRLIDKIDRGLPEIKNRSISALHSKVVLGLISAQGLVKFRSLPGVLLSWINDNNTRSELLFKVLTILTHIAYTQQGLILLEQYEATDFFKELKMFLLSQQPKHDQYVNSLEQMIKVLLPLTPTIKEEPEPTVQSKGRQSDNVEKPAKDSTSKGNPKADLELIWTISREILAKKEEDELYGLLMELRHGKRQLHLEWLKRLLDLAKYWGRKHFRFRAQLISELLEQLDKSKLRWLIIDILRALLRGVNQNAEELKRNELDLISLSNSKVLKPETDQVSITLKFAFFQTTYSAALLEDILTCVPTAKNGEHIYEWLLYLPYKFTPKYFILALKYYLSGSKRNMDLGLVNKQLELYCPHFNGIHSEIAQVIGSADESWNLKADNFPVLMSYLKQMEKSSSYTYIAKYAQDWQLGSNLHSISQVMDNLEKGVEGIAFVNPSLAIRVYVDCLLTLAVGVQKQDPIMTAYPTMKKHIIRISRIPQLRTPLFEEILSTIHSHTSIYYGSKKYIRSQLAVLVFSEEQLFKILFSEAFSEEDTLANWLQAMKGMVLGDGSTDIDTYSTVLYCLQYHKQSRICELAKVLTDKLTKKGRVNLIICRLFSKSQEERTKICKDLFRDQNHAVLVQISTPQTAQPPKKLLKIAAQTIQNYAKILFNQSLEEQVRISGAQQLLESIQRIQLTPQLTNTLTIVSQNLLPSIQRRQNITPTFLSILIQLNGLLNNILPDKCQLSIDQVVELLSTAHLPKTVQMLLQQLYVQCFRNPFTEQRQLHFTSLLYPHIQYVPFEVTPAYSNIKVDKNITLPPKSDPIVADYRTTMEFEHFVDWVLFQLINSQSVKLGTQFTEIVEKQIGQIIHASKSYASLHFLAYGFTILSQHRIALPDKIADYSSPLLNNLLAKDQSAINSEPVAVLLSIIGCKRVRQLQTLLANSPHGYWKYPILLSLPSVDTNLIEMIIKGLLGLSYGRQATQILRLLLVHGKTAQLNSFSQNLLLSSALKFIRQDTDSLLRKTSLCFLAEFYGTSQLQPTEDNDLFSSLSGLLLGEPLPTGTAVMIIQLIKQTLQQNGEAFEQANTLKVLLAKLASLLTVRLPSPLLAASIFQIFNLVVSKQQHKLLGGVDLVDLALALLNSTLQKKEKDERYGWMLIGSIFDFLFLWCEVQLDLPKYLLTSSQVLQHLISSFSRGQTCILKAASRLWLRISQTEEDLFIYKLNQIMSTSMNSLLHILCSHLQMPTPLSDYLKMLGWTFIIWTRGRQQLEGQLGAKMASACLRSSDPSLIKWVLPFSLDAKIVLLGSSLLQQQLKQALTIVQSRIVKETKEKKKKTKPFTLDQKEESRLLSCLSLLSAFFYSAEIQNRQIQASDGLKRIMSLIEKIYCCGQWQQNISKAFLKVVTNMALSTPFLPYCSSRLAESSIMIEEMISTVIKTEHIDPASKMALRMLSVLVQMEGVRAMVLRGRVVEQLSSRLCRGEQKGDISIEHVLEIVELMLSMSAHKDANGRLLQDKKVLEILVRMLKLGKLPLMEEKIVLLLANLACYKHNKPTFTANKEFHKVLLGLLEDPATSYRPALLTLLYNLLFKHAAALRIYRRPEVLPVVQTASALSPCPVAQPLCQLLLAPPQALQDEL